jgi:hypothetical protein
MPVAALRLPDLLDQAFTRADWLRLIRRLARSRSLKAAELLLRARFGAPPKSAVAEAAEAEPEDNVGFWLPIRDGENLSEVNRPAAPAAPSGRAAVTALLDEALSPADWASLLRWLLRSKTPGALELLLHYRYGLHALSTVSVKPVGVVRFYDPAIPESYPPGIVFAPPATYLESDAEVP